MSLKKIFRAAVVVLSDKGSRGERIDESGSVACDCLKQFGYEVVERILIPDEPDLLKQELIRLSDEVKVNLIITSGGTGFSPRDITPEATLEIMDRSAPGISEYIRMKSMQITDRAMLSRGVSVIRKQTLIVNLPGSPKAVKEGLELILKPIGHGLVKLCGDEEDCARS